MATTPTTPAPAPVPAPAAAVARANARAAAAAKAAAGPTLAAKPGGRVVSMKAWGDALEQARTATGYEGTSPIFGKTDIEVMGQLKTDVETVLFADPTIVLPGDYIETCQKVVSTLQELLKRKASKQLAGSIYRSAKK